MMWRVAWCGILALLTFSASPSWALATGQCLPAAEVRAALAAENQPPIIVGNHRGFGFPAAFILTANATGSNGYALRGDKAFGEQADRICVDSVYRDIRLNDVSKPGIPAWAKIGGDPKAISAFCKSGKIGYQGQCQAFDVSLVNLTAHGHRVMFMATGTTINPQDRSVRENQRLVVTLDPSRGAGSIDAVTSEGAGYLLAGYSEVSYTQHGEELIAAR